MYIHHTHKSSDVPYIYISHISEDTEMGNLQGVGKEVRTQKAYKGSLEMGIYGGRSSLCVTC